MFVQQTRRHGQRSGSVIPMLAVCVIALFGFVALAIDLGMLMVARTECQNAADSAALVGARTLDNDVPEGVHSDSYNNQKEDAEENAKAAILANVFLNSNYTAARIEDITVGLYDYNTNTNQFTPDFSHGTKPSGKAWSAVTVRVNGDQPTYFGRVLGVASLPTSARAVAVHRPRDIALVLDFTGSMGYSTVFSRSNIHLNADPSYPQAGHYSRYLLYQTTDYTASQTQNTIGNRPNPLRHTGVRVEGAYVYSPGNFTIQNENGPPIVGDFYYDPANINNPTNPVVTVNPGNMVQAFVHTTFSPSMRSASGVGPTPAPDNFKNQTDDPVSFSANGGDRYPRKRGFTTTNNVSWAGNTSNGAAATAAEYLGWANNYASGSSLPGISPFPNGRNLNNFRDATWERYGYDLDVAHYVANRGSSWDARWDWNLSSSSWQHSRSSNPSNTFRPQLKPVNDRFKGYTMGPGYWGKTFFIWPPDPRPDRDWRRLYFMRYNGTAFATTGGNLDADTRTTGTQSINGALLTNGNGDTLKPLTGTTNTYAVNYPAILAWIKSGPPVLPPNLRSGRVVYYTSIPDNVDFNSGTTEQRIDKRFWKAYIDYVIRGAAGSLAGIEQRGWPENGTASVTPSLVTGELTAYDVDGNGSLAADPRPYMAYTDNPSRPRMHFWFGPLTMMGFVCSKTMLSGTSHQAQCWQLKAGVNSALDDIKANHPNDLVGLSFFSKNVASGNTTGDYTSIMVPIGQRWPDLKNALFYPRTLLNVVDTNPSAEFRPYDNNINYTGRGNIPNSQGNTDPNTGLALAFNILAPSQYVVADPTRRGRRGAAKIVIFETDGVPNSARNAVLQRRGYDTYYSNISGNHSNYSQNESGGRNAAFEIVNQMVKPMASNNNNNIDSGLSMPSARCRVYAIGFGDIFSTSAGPAAADFLLEIQKRGGTSNAGPNPPADTALPPDQIITGTFDTRIENLRTALERILQSGVQVTLIE